MSCNDLLVIGFAGDPTTEHVIRCLSSRPYDFLELFEYYETGEVSVGLAERQLVVRSGAATYDLGQYRSIFQRLLAPAQNPVGKNATRLHHSRFRAMELALLATPAKVVNRPYSGWENNYRPLQTALLHDAGFLVPQSLSTSMLEEYLAFSRQHQTIYKSNSGARSIVNLSDTVSPERLAALPQCPVFFQERIPGHDVRVHSVAGRAFAVSIHADVVDYRYARREGKVARFRPCDDVPQSVADLCLSYAASRNVDIAGFDFKVTASNRWYCLEMNPCPGFESYDRILDGAIAEALIDLLRAA